MNNWKHVLGSQSEIPAEFDSTSSENYVYQRRNIKRINIQNHDGTEYQLWEYEERTMTHHEFALISEISKTQKDIAAIEDALCYWDSQNLEASS